MTRFQPPWGFCHVPSYRCAGRRPRPGRVRAPGPVRRAEAVGPTAAGCNVVPLKFTKSYVGGGENWQTKASLQVRDLCDAGTIRGKLYLRGTGGTTESDLSPYKVNLHYKRQLDTAFSSAGVGLKKLARQGDGWRPYSVTTEDIVMVPPVGTSSRSVSVGRSTWVARTTPGPSSATGSSTRATRPTTARSTDVAQRARSAHVIRSEMQLDVVRAQPRVETEDELRARTDALAPAVGRSPGRSRVHEREHRSPRPSSSCFSSWRSSSV